MNTNAQHHCNNEIKPDGDGNGNRLGAKLLRFKVPARLTPASAGGRKTLSVILLGVVLPMMLLGIVMVNFLTSTRDSGIVNSQRMGQALESILENQAESLVAIAADPVLSYRNNGGNESISVSQRLGQLIDIYPGFESLALVDSEGEVAATAGILHQDFYLWQNTSAYYDSLNSRGRPSISPLKLSALVVDDYGVIDLSNSRIEQLVFTAGIPDPSTGNRQDGLVVGIMKSDTLVNSVQQLIHNEPIGAGGPNSLAAITQESPGLNDSNSDIQLLSLTPEEIAGVTPISATQNPIPYNSLSPVEETGASWYSVLQSLSTQQSRQPLAGSISLGLATGSVILAIATLWFILRRPQNTEGATAKIEHLSSASESVPAYTVDASKEVSRRLVSMQESVRREMADYLHGHVQSKLLALSMSLETCRKLLESDPHQASQTLEQVQHELQKVQDEDLRQVSRELYPAIIKMGLVPAMRSLISRFKDLLEIDLIIDADVFALDAAGEDKLPEKQRLGVYRIAEEAINNILKHARAKHVEVTLICNEDGNLVMSVVDDGGGFDSDERTDCQGLAMMTDYAEAIGGRTEIRSIAHEGSTVRLILYLESKLPNSPVPEHAGEPQPSLA